LDSTELKKEHKFFTKDLDLDLDSVFEYVEKLNESMLEGKFPNISKELAAERNESNGMATSLSTHYNIFTMPNGEIYDLYIALRETTIKACDYYGIDFKKAKFQISGWFNYDQIDNYNEPPDEERFFHEHYGGKGFPDFHGYYSVKSEPSNTLYRVDDKEEITYVKNKNNRLILSETGHPHTRGSWKGPGNRVTIAYDIIPLKAILERTGTFGTATWIPL
tara:strand:+ start:1948 stop:2607 length:660 start_codon:yes stop_codon:yes gene_type:complete